MYIVLIDKPDTIPFFPCALHGNHQRIAVLHYERPMCLGAVLVGAVEKRDRRIMVPSLGLSLEGASVVQCIKP